MSTIVDPVTGEQFEYRTRQDWGAQPPRKRYTLATSRLGIRDHWVVAHPPGTIAQVDALARSIQHQHKNVLGWYDYAYNMSYGTTADGRGYVVEGRGIGIANGAQGGGNECHAISWYGGSPYPPGGGPDNAGYRARICVERIIAQSGFNVSPSEGHRVSASTACPGNEIMAWIARGRPIHGSPITPPKPPKPPTGGMDDRLKYWKPNQTRSLARKSPMMNGSDVAEFQFTGNLTTNGQQYWTEVDGFYGDDSVRLCTLLQQYGKAFGLYNGKIDGIAGMGTRHIVVATLNGKGIW